MSKNIMSIKLQKRLLEEHLEITDARIGRLNSILIKKSLQKSAVGTVPRHGANQTFGGLILPVIASHDDKMTASGCTLGDLRVERTQRFGSVSVPSSRSSRFFTPSSPSSHSKDTGIAEDHSVTYQFY